jgi:hypothetical protein
MPQLLSLVYYLIYYCYWRYKSIDDEILLALIMPTAPCAELGGVIDVRQIDEELDINGRMIGALAEGEQVLDPRTMPELVVQGLITHSKRRIELLLLRTQITGDLSV